MISRFSTGLEYRAMVNVILKLVSIRDLLIEIGFLPECPMRLYCDNMTAINIAEMPCFMREPNTFFNLVI